MDMGAINSVGSAFPPQVRHLLTPDANRPNEIDVFDAVDEALNLTKENRNPIDVFHNLDASDVDSFLAMLTELLQSGVVGTELLDLGGEPYQSFVTNGMGDPRLDGAKPYRGRNLDLRA